MAQHIDKTLETKRNIMKISQKIIGTSLMFTLVTDDDMTRTNPPVQTLANLRRLIVAKQNEALQLQQVHQEAILAVRTSLKINQSTATARAQVIETEGAIDACMVEINELQDMVDQVAAAAIDRGTQELTQTAQLVIDQLLEPFNLSQLDTTNESAS